MNSTTFPLFRRSKSETKLVIKFFDENRGEIIQSPTKSRDSWQSVGVTKSTWKSCFNTEVWEPVKTLILKRKTITTVDEVYNKKRK